MNDEEKKIEVNDEIENLHNQIEQLSRENYELRNNLSSVVSMLRFTVGIAYNAHPDNDKIKAMVDKLYTLDGE